MSPRPLEDAWFSALCDEDCGFLGQPDLSLQSCYDHWQTIAQTAGKPGHDNLLLPSGYQVGFAGGIAPLPSRSSCHMVN